ncbi:MAG: hypothetical protein GTN38_02710 [Candidatus Aenigmarchaeota archaeon]|nr:hypothetical protein [Candidatus Aenigmarchaeota archaeon]NIP40548.1 hypothetical protein [Candidatus Aenigmarchaeota archaeon]NIQ18393.1 hypothetical protein [Candidatus Aenigmarchaeota archaeon]
MSYGSDDIVLSRFSVLFNKDHSTKGPYKDKGKVIIPFELYNPSELTIGDIESWKLVRISGDDGFIYRRGQGKFEIKE